MVWSRVVLIQGEMNKIRGYIIEYRFLVNHCGTEEIYTQWLLHTNKHFYETKQSVEEAFKTISIQNICTPSKFEYRITELFA